MEQRPNEMPIAYEIAIECPGCRRTMNWVIQNPIREVNCPTCARRLATFKPLFGLIYVLSNPRMPGLLKIGCTTRTVEDRVSELNASTSAPAPFVIEAAFYTGHPHEDERKIHLQLANARLKDREFFQVTVEKALSICEHVCRARSYRGPSYSPPIDCPKCGGTLETVYGSREERRCLRCEAYVD
jgi:ribosomal protein S27E